MWLLAILRKIPPDEPDILADWTAGNFDILRRTLTRGGHAYQINHTPLSTADWQRHYSDEWRRIQNAKRRYDPNHILAPEQRMFDS